MLNERQKAFCEYYLQTGNAYQSALRAGYRESYARTASRLAARPAMRAYMNALTENMGEDKVACAQEVLATLTSVLRREVGDHVVGAKKERRTYYDENGKKCTEVREQPEILEAPARVSDVNRAAELLAKRYGLFSDKLDVDVGDLVIKVDYGNCRTGERELPKSE